MNKFFFLYLSRAINLLVVIFSLIVLVDDDQSLNMFTNPKVAAMFITFAAYQWILFIVVSFQRSENYKEQAKYITKQTMLSTYLVIWACIVWKRDVRVLDSVFWMAAGVIHLFACITECCHKSVARETRRTITID
jgi:cytochrome c oxidase assembly factor CtaG